jgi:hypothetical protein
MPQMMPTFNYETDSAQLDRRQRLVDALMQGTLQPIQAQTGTPGASTGMASLVQGLAKIAQAYAGQKKQLGIDEERSQLRDRYQADAKAGAERFFDGYSVQPGSARPAVEGNNPSAYVAPGVHDAQDSAQAKRKAIIEAMTSAHPMLQQLGQFGFKETMQKKEGGPTAKDFLGYADQATLRQMAASAGLINFEPKRDIGTVDNTIFDKGSLDVLKLNGAAPQVTKGADGDLYKINQSTGNPSKLDTAPKINVHPSTTIINKGESELMKILGKDTAEAIKASRQQKQAGERINAVVNQLEKLDQQGVFEGPQANIATKLGAFAASVGISVDKEKIGRSEAYTGQLAQEIARYLTAADGVGRSMTNEDREAIMAQFPQLVNSREGRQMIMGKLREAAKRDIDYNAQIEGSVRQRFPEAGRLLDVAPANAATYPQAVQPASNSKRIRYDAQGNRLP